MLYYIYDGSFDGLLTAIYEAYYRKEKPSKILCNLSVQENFLVQNVHIETDHEKARKVYNSIRTKISNEALKNIFYVYLSESENAATYIYNYLRLGWKVGKNIDMHLSDDRVLNVHSLRRKVAREVHFMLGLIRFRQLEHNVYYAPFEPQYNIVGLVAPHFADRLADQNWVIHDIKRNIGALYNQKEWVISDINLKKDIIYSNDEMLYQKLWKDYFKNIAIKDRINPKLQKSNMPMKYWSYLIEKN